ncbi:MAG TPA: stage II sporulation protein R [Bacillota bacterium]|nr:stage II sporulation protein R [Bacillota bacterium]
MLRCRLITVGVIIVLFLAVGTVSTRFGTVKTQTCEAFNRSNLIRLHVIANSDSEEDQAVKLKVRDQILKVTEKFLLNVEDPRIAEQIIRSKLDSLAEAAQAELALQHQAKPVKVQLGEFDFPAKQYSFGVLQAGQYKGLRVVIGEGKGHNWWCVLYPPLCLLSPDAPALKKIKNNKVKVEYRLALLEKLVKSKGLTMNQFWKKWGKSFGML